MTKEMIISSNDHETRVAILEDDLVAELFVERERQRGVVGNIYKGRISKVLPGMQSAFVDIGLERDGFLYVSDVAQSLDDLDDADEGEAEAKPDAAAERGKEAKEAQPRGGRHGRGGRQDEPAEEPRIETLVKEGQEILVQVVKEPLGTKGARLTCHASLAGRFLVFMPTVDHVGVSRKIDSREERSRLRAIVRDFREKEDFTGGIIIRTAAAGRPREDILSDLEYFNKIWKDTRQNMDALRAPTVRVPRAEPCRQAAARSADRRLHRHPHRQLSGIPAGAGAGRADHAVAGQQGEALQQALPDPRGVRVQGELDKALRSKVWLKSGGSIVINQTEALVAVDVNTGRYVGKRSAGRLEDTIVKTNLEAAKEIVRQIRLRDLGGIIVLDFIDMEEKKNRQKVFQAVEQELRRDRAPSKALQVADFGLIVVTRKRVKQSLERVLTEPCPYCSGSGVIKSSSTICYEILAEVRKLNMDLNGHGVVLRVNPDIARALKEEEQGVLRDLEQAVGRPLTLRPDTHLHHEQFDLMAIG